MRSRLTRAIAPLVAVVALVACMGAGVAVSKPAGKKVSCKVNLQQQTSLSKPVGYDLGFVKCPAPLGRGLYHDTFKYTFPTSSTAVANGPFQYYLDTGTVHGTYHLSGKTAGSVLTFRGHVKFTGGTGAFRHVTGTGTETCTTKDGGLHGSCTTVTTLTGI